MQSDDDGGARIGALAQQLQCFELVIGIELVGGFIQQEDARGLRQHRGQCGAPPLAAGQSKHVALFVTRQPDRRQCVRRNGEIAIRLPLPPGDVRMPAEQYRFHDGRREGVLDVLRQ